MSVDLEITEGIAHIVLNRPKAFNAMPRPFWNELPKIVNDINDNARARVIVIFTDGTNNSWDDEAYSSINYVEQRLANMEGLSAYTIGFIGKGDVDKTALRRLAVGGQSEFPESARDLEDVFNKFGSTISSLYTFEYNRNASRFSEPRRLQFSFRATQL